MDKYLVSVNPSSEKSKWAKRCPWIRDLIEINGKFKTDCRHHFSSLIIQSYDEIGALPHEYHFNGEPCPTHVDSFMAGLNYTGQGVSSLEFDSKGVYLASVTKSGCLTVHDFDNIQKPDLKEDEAKQLLHISTGQQLDVVRWNSANQDEIACTSMERNDVHIFDIGYISSEPVEVLRKKPNVTVHGLNVHRGFSDIAFPYDNKSRLLASDTDGAINVWDRRVNNLPCLELTTNSAVPLNSIKISRDNEIIFGASKQGTVFMWDLRGGRSYTTFSNIKVEKNSPLMSVKLELELEKIKSLKAQSYIVSKEIHSIDFNPSCPYQLAFHLDDGWSGVLDTRKCEVTHIHCPPPTWLDDADYFGSLSFLRKPCWLPVNSVYVVGSSSEGLHLLDFYPERTSPCHVHHNDDKEGSDRPTIQQSQNRFLPLSESITACVAHPLNATIVAGSKTPDGRKHVVLNSKGLANSWGLSVLIRYNGKGSNIMQSIFGFLNKLSFWQILTSMTSSDRGSSTRYP